MAKQTINPGTAPTGAGGDTFRSGSAKLQANDDEIYNQLGATAQGVLPIALPINKGGTGGATAAEARTGLGLGSAAQYNIGVEGGDVLAVGNAFGLGWVGERINIASSFELINTIFNKSQFIGINLPGSSAIEAYSSGIFSQCLDTFMYLAAGPLGKLVLISGVMGASGSITETIVKTNKNTWVDGNGFIKAASPIVKLYAEKIELNDEAKLQNILFEKVDVGDYLIKGSSGFAQEGWYIEAPKDANGNLLVAVVYEQLENGDISVKTYDYMLNKKGRIVADAETPLDIPENRWIDLRMQELPQPEIEMPGSTAPPDFQPTGLAQAVATVMESYHDTEQ